jgi:uncharacterized protein with PQ loop repeat
MQFKILDPNVSLSMNISLVIANIINLLYNIPQVWTTYKRKSTRDFSSWFLFLRIIGNVIWVAYAIEVASLLMLINNIVTVAASVFIAYYKVNEIISDLKEKKQEMELDMRKMEEEDDVEDVRSVIIHDDMEDVSLESLIK